MKYALKGFNNTAEHTSNHGFFKEKFMWMEELSIKLEHKYLTNQLLKSRLKFQNIAGHKLEAAMKEFGIDCDGKIALDSGLSTGGFTDCLLQHGASHVYRVDVGYGQVAEKIRTHECVSVIERTNLRYLSELPQLVDLVTLDLSFISILLVMPAVIKVMKADSILITLIKPQFEARRSQVGGGGIVRDPLVHQEVLDRIISGVEEFGFSSKGWIESPIKGAEGNKEFLACFAFIESLRQSQDQR